MTDVTVEPAEGNPLISADGDRENYRVLVGLFRDHPSSWATILSRKACYAYLKEWLIGKTPLLSGPYYDMKTRLYWLVRGIVDFPVCGFCGENRLTRNIESFADGYSHACSAGCPGMKKARVEKIGDACEEKWGCRNFFQSEEGVAAKRGWCESMGVENAFQLESVKEKSRESRKANFGCEYTMQSPEKRELASRSYMEKTGYRHQFSDPSVKEKSRAAKLVSTAWAEGYAKNRDSNRRRRYGSFARNGSVRPVFSEDEFAALDGTTQYTTLLKWRCLECGAEFDAFLDGNWSARKGVPARCPTCHPPMQGSSGAEREVADLVRRLLPEGEDVIERARGVIPPFELDVYVPSRRLAIEFDGLFWHSESGGEKGEFYHLNKTEMCERLGIKLIHVFEDEWLTRRNIVESRVSDVLGVYKRTVYARKCVVGPVSGKDASAFLEDNHIQGPVPAAVSLGLFSEGELVSLMTFGRCRFDKTHEWEMLRFCCRTGCHVPGAASRLLKRFERDYSPKSIVSYADRRWSRGGLYRAIGFRFLHSSRPNYWYTSGLERLSRMRFQKHMLKARLGTFDPAKTEVENMRANGYDRIFDCGNMVFEKTLDR